MLHRRPIRDLIMLMTGAVLGYFYALNRFQFSLHALDPDRAATQVQRYYQSHPNETLVGAALVGIIVLLAWKRK